MSMGRYNEPTGACFPSILFQALLHVRRDFLSLTERVRGGLI
jgi:hypothetical protein